MSFNEIYDNPYSQREFLSIIFLYLKIIWLIRDKQRFHSYNRSVRRMFHDNIVRLVTQPLLM